MDKKHTAAARGVYSASEALSYNAEGRISAIINAYPSKTAAARAAGVTVEQLSRYVKGVNRAPFDTIFRLCAPIGVSLDWVATGRPPPATENIQTERYEILLGNLASGLEAYKQRRSVALPPLTQARLLVLFFRLLSRRMENADEDADEMRARDWTQPDNPVDIAADHDLADILALTIAAPS